MSTKKNKRRNDQSIRSTRAQRELPLETDRLPIFLRAHTAKVHKQSKVSSKTDGVMPPRWPERALLFDTETRTSIDQTLMFGIYRTCTLIDGKYCCDEEGLVYCEQLSKEELNTIGTFVANTFPDIDVACFPAQDSISGSSFVP